VDSLLVKAGSGMATLGIAGHGRRCLRIRGHYLALPFNSIEAAEVAFQKFGMISRR